MKDDASKVYDPDGNTEFAKMLTWVNTDKVWAEPDPRKVRLDVIEKAVTSGNLH